jgi:hypothetical protein
MKQYFESVKKSQATHPLVTPHLLQQSDGLAKYKPAKSPPGKMTPVRIRQVVAGAIVGVAVFLTPEYEF